MSITTALTTDPLSGPRQVADVEIVIPVHNEEAGLERSVRRLHAYLSARCPQRELISRAYNLILRAALRSGFSDAQCGFKAVRSDVARLLVPMIEDEAWFFDTELLVLAEHNGVRIHEVPVDWTDDPDSRVDVVDTAREDLRGVWRMMRRFAAGQAPLAPGALA